MADVTIRINGRKCHWPSDLPRMTYRDVTMLLGSIPRTDYTMTWHYHDADGQHGGSLLPDQSVAVHEGMTFNFAITNGA